jgi:hypothetical protein
MVEIPGLFIHFHVDTNLQAMMSLEFITLLSEDDLKMLC